MKANEAVRVVREELPGFQPGRLKTALETVLADSAKATEMVAQLTGREIDLRAERDAALGDRGKVMELTEAVRIVREQTIPALAGSGGCGHVAALGTVLAALEQAQGEAEEAKLMASIEHSGCEKALAQMDEAVAVMAKALAEVAAAKDGQIEALRENVDLRAEVSRSHAAILALTGEVASRGGKTMSTHVAPELLEEAKRLREALR